MQAHCRFWRVLLLFMLFKASGCGYKHEGNTPNEWLTELGVFDKTRREKAQAAIKTMGTNGIPTYIRVLEPQSKSEPTACRQVVKAFEILGESGAPAVPQLHKLLMDPACSHHAAAALAGVGTPAMQSLRDGLKAAPVKIRIATAIAVATMNERARPAIQELLQLAHDPDSNARSAALSALKTVHGDPDVVVPVLIESFSRGDQEIQIAAILALASYGADAKPAVPLLIKAAKSKSEYLRDAATDALSFIDPEAGKSAPTK